MLLGDDHVWLVDWPHAVVGAPWVDLMGFLPSAVLDGAPDPEAIWLAHPLGAAADAGPRRRRPRRVHRLLPPPEHPAAAARHPDRARLPARPGRHRPGLARAPAAPPLTGRQRPVNVALPGPCSRKLATPVRLSSVPNTSTKPSRSRARPSASEPDNPASTTRLVIAWADERAAGDLGGEGQRPRHRVVVGDLVGEPDRQCLVGLHLATGEAQLLGPARADEAGEALRPAAARDDAEQDLGLAEHRPRAGDAVVARQRQLAAATERVAADRARSRTGAARRARRACRGTRP